jgi:hypothetical protein
MGRAKEPRESAGEGSSAPSAVFVAAGWRRHEPQWRMGSVRTSHKESGPEPWGPWPVLTAS